jgi:hypothetical protein
MTPMTDNWNHNSAYHAEALRAAPGRSGRALDVGCGDGLLMSKLAAGAQVVPVRVLSALHRASTYEGMRTARPRESLGEIRAAATHVLPGCRVRRRFWYRYSLVWTKPSEA